MNQYYLALEGLISIFYIKEMLSLNHNSLFLTMIVLMVYLSLKILYYLLGKHHYFWIKFIPLVICFFLIIFYHLYNVSIIYFLSINIWQTGLEWLKNKKNLLAWSSVIFIFFISLETVENYLLITIFSLMILNLLGNFEFYIMNSQKENSILKKDLEKTRERLLLAKQVDINAKYQSQLEERNLLAQKLHDQLGHTISGSLMQLEALKLLLEVNHKKSKDILDTVIINLRDGANDIRNILKNIKPDISSMNLNNIKTMALETQENSGTKIDLIYNNDVNELTQKIWRIIILNTREALTNMMRYSEAKHCVIQFERMNKIFKVSIKDNGLGCNKIKQGLGLRGMEERLTAVNGTLITDGSNGFSIIMLFPLNYEVEEKA